MTREELETLASGGETEQVEFKRTTGSLSDGLKTTCGMLNSGGGFVFFGIRDDGSIVGQNVATGTLESVVDGIRRIEPHVLIQPEVIGVEGDRSVIALSVPGGASGPYTFEGRPYIRQGPTTRPMPQEAYRRLLLERMHPTDRWETQHAHEIGVQDLDHAELTRTIEEAVRRGRLDEPGTRDPEELLQGLRLMTEGELLNAAVVLFGDSGVFLPHYPQCLLRMARFRGTTTHEFEDNRQVHGNAFELMKRAQSFLREHLPVAGRIVPDLFERRDDPLYPPEALREALANAFCHRDYQSGGGSVSIAIFDDRLEISSTGRLPFGLTVEDLKRPHPSRPWNPLIAGAFFQRGIIEQWGRGTLRMRELIEDAGLAPPEFEERGGEVVVTFYPTGYVAPRRIDHALTDVQQEILEALSQIGPAPLQEVIDTIPSDTQRRSVQHNLQTLRELGLVRLRGYGRGARWRLAGR